MRRVSVVGSGSGAGKTTFARALARRTGLPFVEEATRGEAWVVDGNYSASRDLVWARADTVVWLDLPFAVMLWRTVRRTMWRSWRREVLWVGNRETVWNAFVGRDALIPFFVEAERWLRAVPARST